MSPARRPRPENLDEQDTFQHQELEPRLAEAQAGHRTVLFMDAAHFVQGAVLGMLWCFVRLFIASPSGRRRFNVLGALNAVTKEVLTFTNETYITAESVCQLLTQIAAHYAGTAITVVLDNARYQHCALVLSHAATLQIQLLFLPAYSPHLNLIERYWRFVRKQCLYSKYYPDFTGFKYLDLSRPPFRNPESPEHRPFGHGQADDQVDAVGVIGTLDIRR